VVLTQIGENRAGGVYFCWRGVGVEHCCMAKAIRAAADWRALAGFVFFPI
jgi:hypothetical protein